jgi:hypothetical protein
LVPFQQFSITNGIETSTIISNGTGSYSAYVGAGTHTITPIIENPASFTVSPSQLTVNFPLQNSPVLQDFCISAGSELHDFDIMLIPMTNAIPGSDSTYKLVYKNTGNIVDNGSIILSFEDDVLDFISSSLAPVTNSAGILTWSFTNLMPFETRSIDLTFNLNGPMETPPLNLLDILSFSSSIGESAAIFPFLNNHVLTQTVLNSFDPNDKTCLEGNIVGAEMIGEYVHYVIHFENTGTFPAQNIVVKDIIDISKFDVSTLIPISGSHQFETRISSGNKVEFIFENIMLPFDDATNDGYVAFKIKTLPSLEIGDTFSNSASIYFDYNFPIVTNTATTVIEQLSTNDFEFEDQFTLYPNPAQEVLKIKTLNGGEINSVSFYNTLGQVVLVVTDISTDEPIDVSHLNAGSFFIKINSPKGNTISKFVKQ